VVREGASVQLHARLHHSRRCLRPLRGDRFVDIVESNGVVIVKVEKARNRSSEPDYNTGKFRDLITVESQRGDLLLDRLL
jgi:hypothetical protein